jgi:hypothetical protein
MWKIISAGTDPILFLVQGDVTEVERLLESGAPVEAVTDTGATRTIFSLLFKRLLRYEPIAKLIRSITFGSVARLFGTLHSAILYLSNKP